MLHSGPSLDKPVQLPTLLEVGLKHRPGHPALMSLEESWSWSELEQRTDRLAGHYLALGLKPGDRVASLMPNRTALIAHYLACFKAGLVTTPLNYRYTPSEIDHALEVSGARIILAHAERAADIAASKAAKLPLGVITYGTEGDGNVCLERLVATEPPTTILPAPEPDAPAAIFFTSGSTGPAKGVTHTFELPRLDVRQRGQGLRTDPSRYHAAGFVLLACWRILLRHGRARDWRPGGLGASLRPC